MIRMHFVDGKHIDLGGDFDELIDQIKNTEKARFIHFQGTTVIVDNITYIERIQVDV